MTFPPSPVGANRQKLAQLADQRPQPLGEGYTAERHPLMPELILVWAPCSCLWIGDKTDNFITPCGKPDCQFKWTEAVLALEALKQAEQAPEAPKTPEIPAGVAEQAPAEPSTPPQLPEEVQNDDQPAPPSA